MEEPSTADHPVGSCSSSSPPSRPSSSAQTNTNFAFLVHNQDSISRNSAPNIDNKPLVRQRRRRTSPEDYAILEIEFDRNPKPDRETRRRIVDRVSLGDKEVHIWFQNRRQKTRRKGVSLGDDRLMGSRAASVESSPVPPQEAFTRSFLAIKPSQGLSLPTPNSSFIVDMGTSPIAAEVVPRSKTVPLEGRETISMSSDTQLQDSSSSPVGDDISNQKAEGSVSPGTPPRQFVDLVEDASSIPPTTTTNTSDPPSTIYPDPTTDPTLPAPAETITCETEISAKHKNGPTIPPPQATTNPLQPRTQNSMPQQIRLSFTSSGAALLHPTDEATPSPPRPHLTAPTPFSTRQSLRRSYSAAGLSDFRSSIRSLGSTSSQPTLSQLTPTLSRAQFQHAPPHPSHPTTHTEAIKTAPLLQRERQPFGRSRDSRAWEFWCDASARDLSDQAKMGTDGNARHAIGLLRSRSSVGLRSSATLRRAHSSTSAAVHAAMRAEENGNGAKRVRLSGEGVDGKGVESRVESKVEKPKMVRAQTAGESRRWRDAKPLSKGEPHKKTGLGIFEDGTAMPASPKRILRSPAGDSDKENRGRRRFGGIGGKAADKGRKRALGESRTAPTGGRRVFGETGGRNGGVGKWSGKRGGDRVTDRENADLEDDEEVERFMRGGQVGNEKENGEGAGEDDMAIQGLLSLSQGAWR